MMNLKLLYSVVALSAFTACSTPSQITMDAKVRELCAKDGGITVIETVTLSREMFDNNGNLLFKHNAPLGQPLGPEYVFSSQTTYLVKGDDYRTRPSLTRTTMSITRKADGKVLGTAVRYRRFGGGLESAFPSEGTKCPESLSPDDLFKRVFVRGDK